MGFRGIYYTDDPDVFYLRKKIPEAHLECYCQSLGEKKYVNVFVHYRKHILPGCLLNTYVVDEGQSTKIQ